MYELFAKYDITHVIITLYIFFQFLSDQTAEVEHDLYDQFLQNHIYIRPSVGFYGKELGWFRICFSQPKDIIKVGKKLVKEKWTMSSLMAHIDAPLRNEYRGQLITLFINAYV